MQLTAYCGNLGTAASIKVLGHDARKDIVLGPGTLNEEREAGNKDTIRGLPPEV